MRRSLRSRVSVVGACLAAGVAVTFVSLASAYAQDVPPGADRPQTGDTKKKPAKCQEMPDFLDLLEQSSEDRERNDPDVKAAAEEQAKAQEDYNNTKATADKADAANASAQAAAASAKAAAAAADATAASTNAAANNEAAHPPAGGYTPGVFTAANNAKSAAQTAHANADSAQAAADTAKANADRADGVRDRAKDRLDKANKKLDEAKEKASKKNGGGQQKASLDDVGQACPPPASPFAATATVGAVVALGDRDPPSEGQVRVGADYRVYQTSQFAIDVTGRATLEGGNQFVNVAVAPGVRAPIKLFKDVPVAFVPGVEVGPSYMTWTGMPNVPSQSAVQLRVVATAGVEYALNREITLRAEPGVVADVGTFGNTRFGFGIGAAYRFP